MTVVEYMRRERDKAFSQARWWSDHSLKETGCSDEYRSRMAKELMEKGGFYAAAVKALEKRRKAKYHKTALSVKSAEQ